MKIFKPDKIYFEPGIANYLLGRELLEKYAEIPAEEIENHNKIEHLQKQPNTEFTKLKRLLIIGTRKTHRYTDNEKVSDYLVPYTSSGCTAMCLYCYLVCNYNKCSYLRLFVNREEMLEKIIKKAAAFEDEKVFEIGSNSDLVLENTITGNLRWTIENFTAQPKGKLTFPTKFHMVDDLLDLNHSNRIISRVSINPDYLIRHTEPGTSMLDKRIEAINKLCDSGYTAGILIAPVILVDNYKKLYEELIIHLRDTLNENARKQVFFEVILMTYSFVHDKINSDAFPNALQIYNKEMMTGRGMGKYRYKNEFKEEAKEFMRNQLEYYFPENKIIYIV